MKEISLPSGAVLKLGHIPFAEALTLNKALGEELKVVGLAADLEVMSVMKDLVCIGVSSPKIEMALSACMKRCVYASSKAELKIDKDTFEQEEARQDYYTVCVEVAKHACLPFVKAHSAEFFRLLGNLKGSPESKPKTTP